MHVRLSDSFIGFFGIWTLVQQFSYFAGLTFHQNWLLGWPLSLAGAIYFWKARHDPSLDDSTSNERLALWLAVAAAIILTLCLHRFHGDDEYYLGLSVLALDHEFAAMHSVEGMSVGYAVTAYDFLRAAFSSLTGTPLLASYYLVWPALLAAVIVLFQWRLVKMLSIRNIFYALVMFFVIMLSWGDVHWSPANFCFVRLMNGKSALIWLSIPASMYYWLRFVVHAERNSLMLLLLSVVCGVGFSPTGVTTGILLIGLFILATMMSTPFSGWHSTLPKLVAISIYPLVMGLVMSLYFGYSSPGVYTTSGIHDSVYTSEVIPTVLGDGVRAVIALLCLACLPWLLRDSKAKSLMARYSMICIFLVVFPWTSELLGKYGFMTMAWRWLYVVPFVLAIVVVFDRVVYFNNGATLRLAVASGLAAIFVVASPKWVVSGWNRTQLHAPAYKLADPDQIYLRQFNSHARIDGVWLISPVTQRRL